MLSLKALLPFVLALQTAASPLLAKQQPFLDSNKASSDKIDLSEWSRAVKEDFVRALLANNASDYTVVLGNEGKLGLPVGRACLIETSLRCQ